MNLRLEYQYEWDDLREAGHFVPPVNRSVGGRWLGRVFFALFLAAVAGLVYGLPHGRANQPLPWYVQASLFLLVPLLLFRWWRSLVQSMQRAGWHPAGPRTVAEITEQGVRLLIRGRQTLLGWPEFTHAIEAPTGFLLVKADKRYVFLPKRACSQECPVETLRACLADRISDSRMEESTAAAGLAPGAVVVTSSPPELQGDPQQQEHLHDARDADAPGLAAHENKSKVGVAGGMLLPFFGLVCSLILDPSGQLVGYPAIPTVLCVPLGFALYLWGCWHLGVSRGFKPVHGMLVGAFFPIGLLFLATRAKPLPREVIDRKTFRGLLAAPIAKTKDMRSGW